MEVDTVTQLINSVGFPIVVCLILFWFIKNYLNKIVGTLESFNSRLDKNSAALEKLTHELQTRENTHV